MWTNVDKWVSRQYTPLSPLLPHSGLALIVRKINKGWEKCTFFIFFIWVVRKSVFYDDRKILYNYFSTKELRENKNNIIQFFFFFLQTKYSSEMIRKLIYFSLSLLFGFIFSLPNKTDLKRKILTLPNQGKSPHQTQAFRIWLN